MRLLLLLVFTLACTSSAPGDQRDSGRVQLVERDDPAMTAAIRDARGTVRSFVARLARGPVSGSVSVKAPVTDGQDTEHLWLAPVRVANGRFHGVVANEPVLVEGLEAGDTLSIPIDSISDWMLVDRDTVFGGFTVHLMRARMSAGDRQAFDASQRLVFGSGPRPLP